MLMAYQVFNTCGENRDEAQVAKTAKTPSPSPPATSPSAGPSPAGLSVDILAFGGTRVGWEGIGA